MVQSLLQWRSQDFKTGITPTISPEGSFLGMDDHPETARPEWQKLAAGGFFEDCGQ